MFGGQAAVSRSNLTIYGEPHTIVGVMPPNIDLPSEDAGLWVTMKVAERFTTAQDRTVPSASSAASAGWRRGHAGPGAGAGGLTSKALAAAYPRATPNFVSPTSRCAKGSSARCDPR